MRLRPLIAVVKCLARTFSQVGLDAIGMVGLVLQSGP